MLAAVDRAEALGDHVTAARGLNNIVDLVPVEQRRSIIERMHVNAESAGFAALAAYSYAEHLAELASLSADRAELDRWLTHAWRWRRLGPVPQGDALARLLLGLARSRSGRCRRARSATPQVAIAPVGVARTGRRMPTSSMRRREATPGRRVRPSTPGRRRTKSVKDKLYHLPNVVEAALRAGVPDDALRQIVDDTIPADARVGPSWEATMAFLEAHAGRRAEAADHVSRVGDELERWLRGELELQLAELALAEGANSDAAEARDGRQRRARPLARLAP